MDSTVDNRRRIGNLIRVGLIAEIDHANARARLRDDDLLTGWLPWLERRAGATRSWNPPTLGEQALLLCEDGDPANGVIITGLYSDAHAAPSADPLITRFVMPDGAEFEYDHGIHRLSATVPGSATLDCDTTVDVTAGGNLTAEAGGNATIEAAGAVDITGANGITLNGDVTINGNTVFNGAMTHGGRRVDSTHGHGGVQGGNSTTGPVA